MRPYPHTYVATVSGSVTGLVTVTSQQLPSLQTAPPPEFDGPADIWSPETLLCAAVADCFVLTFRAVARAARFEWALLECRVEGTLERVNGASQFTQFTTFADLSVSPGTDCSRARETLERAERGCLIANSLRASRLLESRVLVK